ncbi:MAG: hypothetical protein JWP63_3544 [Candidatus Solibacter sp.]|jgi:hypothetical protein|nr:hypothetical protein [Candidatus Solibacter sp.]
MLLSSRRMSVRISDPDHGLWLNFSPKPSDSVHHFCGPNDIEGASCPYCRKPLIRVLSLAATDSRLNLDPSKTAKVHLLYCWTCSIPYGVFSYRILNNGSIELLQIPPTWESAIGPDGPYDGYTGHYPQKLVALRQLEIAEHQRQLAAQSDIDLALELMPQKHQVGGFPIIANPQEITCPICSQESPLLAVICDDVSGNQPGEIPAQDSFTDNMGTQMVFHYCRDCSVVSAYHSND